MITKINLILIMTMGILILQSTSSNAQEGSPAYEENRVCSEAAFFDVKEKAENQGFLDKLFRKKNYAQFHLCTRYMTGCGTFTNVVKGGIACKEAAESGVAEASLYIADLYHYGKNKSVISFPVQFKKAEQYYKLYMKQSADNVDKFVYEKLAELYETGDFFLKQDLKKADQYKKMAEEK